MVCQQFFYQTYWDTVGHDVVEVVQSFFRDRYMLKDLNFTFITLIPKNDKASLVTHYRPISLCNVLYKIISKLLSNRLKPFLQRIISPTNQAAFVSGRNIAENVILTQEVLHSFKPKKDRVGSMAVKLDMAKAFDRLEWSFIKVVFKNLGFSTKFISLIM